MEKKYQIFISSTYKDLIEARSKVRDAILSMMHFPVGMEMFNAADEEQWEIGLLCFDFGTAIWLCNRIWIGCWN